MKKVLLSIAVGAAFVSAYAQHNTSLPQERYDISGTCSSDAKWVYIIDPAARNAKVDSVEVTGGKFKISGTDAKNNFLGITDNGPVFLPFLNDGTKKIVGIDSDIHCIEKAISKNRKITCKKKPCGI